MAKMSPRERKGQYMTTSGASQRRQEAASVRKDTMPMKKGKKGCNY